MSTIQSRLQAMVDELAEKNEATAMTVMLTGTIAGGASVEMEARFSSQRLADILSQPAQRIDAVDSDLVPDSSWHRTAASDFHASYDEM